MDQALQDVEPFAGHSPEQHRPLGGYGLLGSDALQIAYRKLEDQR